MPPYEAAAAGRLVIGTPVGDFPRLCLEGMGVLGPLNDQAFEDFAVTELYSPTPAQVANAIITCTETICTTSPSNTSCTQLEGAVMGCLTSGGNVAICLAGIPSLVSVGYADIACIVAALATPAEGTEYKALATNDVQQKAAAWLASQRITIRQ